MLFDFVIELLNFKVTWTMLHGTERETAYDLCINM